MPFVWGQQVFMRQPRQYPIDLLTHDLDAETCLADRLTQHQQYTKECLSGEEDRFETIDIQVILPPLQYQNRFVKGLYYSQGTEVLAQELKDLSVYYYAIADSQWGAYPWSRSADAYFTLYENPEYLAHFQAHATPPEAIRYIPCQAADHINEMIFTPLDQVEKDIDLFCMTHYLEGGHLALVATALKAYRQTYPESPIRLYLATGHEYDLNFSHLNAIEMETLRAIQTILIHPRDYIHFVSGNLNQEELTHYLNRSKALLFPHLVGEKGIILHQAMSTNVPIICFKNFNEGLRGNQIPLPAEAGVCCEFNTDSLVQAIHDVLACQPDSFHPRKAYLREFGKNRFFDTCLNAFQDCYLDVIPHFSEYAPHQHYWLHQAMTSNYGLTLYDFLFQNHSQYPPFLYKGLSAITSHLQQLEDRFQIITQKDPVNIYSVPK
jgi:hypothetical protein